MLVICNSVSAQKKSKHKGKNELVYPDDLDAAKVDSFFNNFTIDLHKCDKPGLYFEVYRWYKTCYRYGGGAKSGIDCSGFTHMLFEKIYDKKIPNSAPAIFEQCRPLRKHEMPAEGDLVFFKIKQKKISHVGVYLQHNKFAHATTQAGVIISDLDEPYYKKYFFKAGRIE